MNKWDKNVKVEENAYYWKGFPIITKASIKNSNSNKPTVVELFSGCGGTSKGFEMAGYEILLGLDIHKPSIDTFKRNHPNSATILGDVREVTPEIIKDAINDRPIDVLIAGIPCQGFSLNNRKRHETDERNFLFKEFVRFVSVLKPKVVVVENVSGLRSMANGKFVDDIKEAIKEVGNYNIVSSMLYAPDYGVPQKRKRIVFVGILDEEFDFSEIIKTHGGNRPFVTVSDAIGDLPNLKSGESSNKYKTEPKSEYQKLMRSKDTGLVNHQAPKHPDETIKKIADTKPGEPMYSKYKQRIRLKWDDLSPTQVSGGIRPQFQFGHPEDSRGLTIRERCRLQSFPDDFIVEGGIVQGRVQTGNAVPPLLAKALAKAILNYLK